MQAAPPPTAAPPAAVSAPEPSSGRVKLRCHVEPDGAVSGCAVLEEAPSGVGLGTAALRLSTKLRMKPRTVDGRPVQGGTVVIPLTFRAGGPATASQNE